MALPLEVVVYPDGEMILSGWIRTADIANGIPVCYARIIDHHWWTTHMVNGNDNQINLTIHQPDCSNSYELSTITPLLTKSTIYILYYAAPRWFEVVI